MKLGNVEGDINGLWQVAHDSGELTSAVTSYDITGLEGDTDIEYQIISRIIGVDTGGCTTYANFNNDVTTSNYGDQAIRGVNAAASASRSTTYGGIRVGYNTDTSRLSFSKVHIFAKSGKERTAILDLMDNTLGTTVIEVQKSGNSWDNTVDELTSIKLTASVAGNIGIGSRIILLKKVHNDGMKTGTLTPNKIKGAWERIYDSTLSSAATSVTISGLEGNTDVLYRLIVRSVKGTNSGNNAIRPNSDSGNNYGSQYLKGQNTTASSLRGTADNYIYLGTTTNADDMAMSDTLIYAKSGYERTILALIVSAVNGTTVDTTQIQGNSWNNTADEITSLLVYSTGVDGLGIGTHIELYRLNL